MNITLEGEVASRQPDSISKRETRNEKRLRNAAIAFSYRHYVAAYSPSRVHRAVPSNQNRQAAFRPPMAPRNQAWRLAQVSLYSRPGNDLTRRFPLIADALARLRSQSCIIDGEAVACDDNGVASFNLIRYRRHDDSTF